MTRIVFILLIAYFTFTIQQQPQCPIGHLSFTKKKCIFAQTPSIDRNFFDAESDCKRKAATAGFDEDHAFLISIPSAFENAEAIGTFINSLIFIIF